MTFMNSTMEPGHPWVMINGNAWGSGDLTWMKCSYGTGPSVGDDQRQRVGFWRSDVDEMQLLPVDCCRVLRELIEPRLMCSPVVGGSPVLRQVADVVER